MRSLVRLTPAVVLVVIVAVLTDVRAHWVWYAVACAGVAAARQLFEARLTLAALRTWPAPSSVQVRVQFLAEQADVRVRSVRAVAAGTTGVPFAHAIGSGRQAHVLVSDGLLSGFDPAESDALLARAVSRLQPSNVVRRALGSVLRLLTVGALTGFVVQAMIGWRGREDGSLLALLGVGYLLAMAGLFAVYLGQRFRLADEHRADDLAAALTSRSAVLDALSRLGAPDPLRSRRFKAVPRPSIERQLAQRRARLESSGYASDTRSA